MGTTSGPLSSGSDEDVLDAEYEVKGRGGLAALPLTRERTGAPVDLPSPEVLADYERLVPGTAARLLRAHEVTVIRRLSVKRDVARMENRLAEVRVRYQYTPVLVAVASLLSLLVTTISWAAGVLSSSLSLSTTLLVPFAVLIASVSPREARGKR